MKKFDLRILWGGLLIVAGGLFLMQELNVIPSVWGIIWSLLFGIAGFAFLYVYYTNQSHWWPLIPGIGLLSLGILIFVDQFISGAEWTGAIFLGGIGISFWLVYVLNRENWWAVIPGGVLITLAVISVLDSYVSGDAGGAIFMLGLSLTFLIVGLLKTSHENMRWAFIPAVIFLVIGIFLFSSSLSLLNYIWPVVLIILGLYFILRNVRAK